MGVELSISMAKWMTAPAERWNAGLDRAGLGWVQGLHEYTASFPPIPPKSTYERTMTMGNKARYQITELGKTMEFGSTYYAPDVLQYFDNWQSFSEELKRRLAQDFVLGVKEYEE